MTTERVEIPISLVAHTVFCERRAWLEAAGEQVINAQIEAGHAAHSAVDNPRTDQLRTRSLDISHGALGLSGRCDVLRAAGSEAVSIVEYKSTPVRRTARVTDANVIQLALQRMCLEASGIQVVSQEVYFTNHRRAVQVPLTTEDLQQANRWVATTRQIIERKNAPAPLIDDPRCSSCSHVSICLPDEHNRTGTRRRVSVSDPHGDILHLTSAGSRASLRSGRVIVARRSEEIASVPLERVVGMVVHGNVDISSALVREILWRGYTIVWCSSSGRVVGSARSASSPNGLARVKQHVASEVGHLELAREFISSKVANQATQLRRNAKTDVGRVVKTLRDIAQKCGHAADIPHLYGLEGEAAAFYFGNFSALLADGADPEFAKSWPGRTGRGAGDPLNVLLNYAYGLLLTDTIRALHACGLDPNAGFLHTAARNKPALALDLMEEFRAPVADSTVVGMINNGEIVVSDLPTAVGRRLLSDKARRALASAYQRRVQQEFKHPVFGYAVSWRRAMEVQARMILGMLDGTSKRYTGIRTR
ncbi:CRISPR-associated endonuclease Cas4/Cas1 [Mycolicibacter longobardus]|uniref:CRISPR-associated endonuclease Cas1 n=1 Tax=Mycolicibacter longobardus TaxID=1108812 RepID=A0A1X1YKC1_9MYCO|nr:CRISPR-associated endonuclease Cas4/Cas1 [Mycolicibacter longobardus]MCV7383972.1 CRISPR-associated endonuclease Cas4/Cas1 [Mycolicibacter longobardus]ORW11567.1 CRISPR-associated protein Cas1 [Mycolicibacter longobardus]